MINDTRLINRIANLEKRLNEYTSSSQPPTSDWSICPVRFEYTSSTRMTALSGDPSQFIQIGDKIRYKQGGGFKYGYVYKATSTYIDIASGSDYSIANAPITDVGISAVSTPDGFPGVFNYDANYRVSGGGSLTGTEESIFSVQGNIVRVELNATFMTFASAGQAWLDLPIPAEVGDVQPVFIGQAFQGVGAGNVFLTNTFIEMNPSYDAIIYRYEGSTDNATTFGTGAGRWSWTQVLTYQIEI